MNCQMILDTVASLVVNRTVETILTHRPSLPSLSDVIIFSIHNFIIMPRHSNNRTIITIRNFFFLLWSAHRARSKHKLIRINFFRRSRRTTQSLRRFFNDFNLFWQDWSSHASFLPHCLEKEIIIKTN